MLYALSMCYMHYQCAICIINVLYALSMCRLICIINVPLSMHYQWAICIINVLYALSMCYMHYQCAICIINVLYALSMCYMHYQCAICNINVLYALSMCRLVCIINVRAPTEYGTGYLPHENRTSFHDLFAVDNSCKPWVTPISKSRFDIKLAILILNPSTRIRQPLPPCFSRAGLQHHFFVHIFEICAFLGFLAVF